MYLLYRDLQIHQHTEETNQQKERSKDSVKTWEKDEGFRIHCDEVVTDYPGSTAWVVRKESEEELEETTLLYRRCYLVICVHKHPVER